MGVNFLTVQVHFPYSDHGFPFHKSDPNQFPAAYNLHKHYGIRGESGKTPALFGGFAAVIPLCGISQTAYHIQSHAVCGNGEKGCKCGFICRRYRRKWQRKDTDLRTVPKTAGIAWQKEQRRNPVCPNSLFYREVREKNKVHYEYYCLDETQEVPADYTEIFFVCLRSDGCLELPATVKTACQTARKKLPELLCHSDVSTTMNVYAHATREAKRTSARLLDKVVGE